MIQDPETLGAVTEFIENNHKVICTVSFKSCTRVYTLRCLDASVSSERALVTDLTELAVQVLNKTLFLLKLVLEIFSTLTGLSVRAL